MASTYDFTLTGDAGAAHGVVLAALAAEGHQAAPLADGTIAISRGSGTKTFWLGAMAGRGFHTRFTLQFFDGQGSTVARFTRVGALGGLKGGVIGASKTTAIFSEAARAIDAAARGAGIFGGVTEHA